MDTLGPHEALGLRRRVQLNHTAIDLGGTADSSTGSCTYYGYLPVNTGARVRVVRIQAQQVASAKTGTASTEPVVAIYRAATTVLASCSSMTLTLSASCPIGQCYEGTDDANGLVFSASDRIAAALYTAGVGANAAGDVHLAVEYIDGPAIGET